jgi:hypothetical protein
MMANIFSGLRALWVGDKLPRLFREALAPKPEFTNRTKALFLAAFGSREGNGTPPGSVVRKPAQSKPAMDGASITDANANNAAAENMNPSAPFAAAGILL